MMRATSPPLCLARCLFVYNIVWPADTECEERPASAPSVCQPLIQVPYDSGWLDL